MGKKRTLRATGLANIAALLAQSPDTVAAGQDKPQGDSVEKIAQRTTAKIVAQVNVGPEHGAGANLIASYVTAGVREGRNLGHREGLEQSAMVESMMESQFETRTKLAVPVVVAAIMEHLGLPTLVLDMDALSTVFERSHLDFTAHEIDDDVPGSRDWIEYTLTPIADEQAPPAEGTPQ